MLERGHLLRRGTIGYKIFGLDSPRPLILKPRGEEQTTDFCKLDLRRPPVTQLKMHLPGLALAPTRSNTGSPDPPLQDPKDHEHKRTQPPQCRHGALLVMRTRSQQRLPDKPVMELYNMLSKDMVGLRHVVYCLPYPGVGVMYFVLIDKAILGAHSLHGQNLIFVCSISQSKREQCRKQEQIRAHLCCTSIEQSPPCNTCLHRKPEACRIDSLHCLQSLRPKGSTEFPIRVIQLATSLRLKDCRRLGRQRYPDMLISNQPDHSHDLPKECLHCIGSLLDSAAQGMLVAPLDVCRPAWIQGILSQRVSTGAHFGVGFV